MALNGGWGRPGAVAWALVLAVGLAFSSGCAVLLHGAKGDATKLAQVKRLALVSYTALFPFEGAQTGFVSLTTGGPESAPKEQSRWVLTNEAERFDVEVKVNLSKRFEYLTLRDVVRHPYMQLLKKEDTLISIATTGTTDLFRYPGQPNMERLKELIKVLEVDAAILVSNEYNFKRSGVWKAAIEPAVVRVINAQGDTLFDGRIAFHSERFDRYKTALDPEDADEFLSEPTKRLARWFVRELERVAGPAPAGAPSAAPSAAPTADPSPAT